MGLHLTDVTQANYQTLTFEPTLKRETVDFQHHGSEKWHLQIFNSNSIKDWGVAELKLKNRKVTQEDVAYYSDRKGLIADKREWIEEQVDRRIQLFFQQAILCFNTPFYYEAFGAEDQIGVGSKVNLNGAFTHKTQAAHPSTFPCLYAYPKDEFGNIDRAKRFVFLKYSHSYNQHNATVELPDECNQADCLLDGTTAQGKLRGAGIKIINDVAEGKINPTKATKRFLKVFEGRLQKMLLEMDKDDLRRDVLEIYCAHVQEVRAEIKDSSEIFDRIMGVKLCPTDEVLREVVYKKRYTLIQQAEFIESRVAKRIFEAQKTMFQRRTKSLKSVDYRLRYALLEGSKTSCERKFFEKLFCTSLDQLKTNMENKQAKLRKVENAVSLVKKNHANELQVLRTDLLKFREELEELELQFRSKLFKSLREDFKHWKQNEFVKFFQKGFPNDPMSAPMVSRLEYFARPRKNIVYLSPESQRIKKMDIQKAQKIAATFGIDAGLFMPGLIASL